jgi:hypothetical protein
MADNPRDIDE